MDYALFNQNKFTYLAFDATHRKTETFDINRASAFDEDKAYNVLENSIAPMEKYMWKVVPIPQSGFNSRCNINSCDTDAIKDSIDKSYVMTELSAIMKAAERLNNYIVKLDSQLSEYDRQQQDVLHYIEKYDLNACEGFKVYKLLKEIRVQRRIIKNEIRKVQSFDVGGLGMIDYGKVLKRMAELDSHTDYNPRVLNDLFTQHDYNYGSKITVSSENCG